MTVAQAPSAFHVMVKPTGAMCNLECECCFFLSKELVYPGSRFRMAEELQETHIRQVLERASRTLGRDVNVTVLTAQEWDISPTGFVTHLKTPPRPPVIGPRNDVA